MPCDDGRCDCASCSAEKRFSQISAALSQRKTLTGGTMDASTHPGPASVISRAVGSGPANTHGPGCAMEKGPWGKNTRYVPNPLEERYSPSSTPNLPRTPQLPGMYSARRQDGTIDPIAFYGGSTQRKHSPGCREFNGRNGYPLNNPLPEGTVQFQRPISQVTAQFRDQAQNGNCSYRRMQSAPSAQTPPSMNDAGIFFKEKKEGACNRHAASDCMLREMISQLEEAACNQINATGNRFEKKFHKLQEEYRIDMECMINEIEAAQQYIIEMENGQAEQMRQLLESFDIAKNRVGLLSEYLHVQAVPHICDPLPESNRGECGPYCEQ